MKGVLVINFKAYEPAFNLTFAERLAREASRISSSLGLRIILAVPSILAIKIKDLHEDIYLEHVDPVDFGAYTGRIPPASLKMLGIKGSIINHSEHKLILREVHRIIKIMNEIGIESIACGDTPSEVSALAYMEPTMIAVEPPELIGTGISVSKARPEVITESLEAIKRTGKDLPLLAGAGITSEADVRRAIELGAKGVLVASAVMKAKEPVKVMRSLAEPLSSV